MPTSILLLSCAISSLLLPGAIGLVLLWLFSLFLLPVLLVVAVFGNGSHRACALGGIAPAAVVWLFTAIAIPSAIDSSQASYTVYPVLTAVSFSDGSTGTGFLSLYSRAIRTPLCVRLVDRTR